MPLPPVSVPTDPPIQVDGDANFVLGMNGYTDPLQLRDAEYVMGMNTINRGGTVQTRPGSESLLNLPEGQLQGMTSFTPDNGIPHLVVAVSGKIYVSPSPFTAYTQLTGIQFKTCSRFIAWASCLQSTDYDEQGNLYFLDAPHSVLVMADGATRSAYWDGVTAAHLNPTPTPPDPTSSGVIAATNSSPIVLTLNGPLVIATGWTIDLAGVQGNTAANGRWTVTVIDSNHISLNGSTGNGTYTTGGVVTTVPDVTGEVPTLPGYDGTPVGLWMAWSNNRLWLSSGNTIIASDIGNPLKFSERKYLNEGRAFYLPGNCTGVAEVSDRSGVMCFTMDTGTFLLSSLQDRTQWLATPNFQQLLLPKIGCVAPRSIVEQYGLLWWYTPKGLISQNNALRINITSRIDVQDNQMIQSKYNISWDMAGIAGGYVENFLYHAVPNGDKLNTRIHVLDQAPFSTEQINSWPSYWEGWRPVEFARTVIGGQERVFCASVDYDGINRVWELFKTTKTDNGVPITSFLLTRPYLFGNRDYKRFRYAEIELEGLYGQTAVMAAVAGTRGAFQPILTKDISSTTGQVYADSQYGYQQHTLAGSRQQVRVVRTQDNPQATECNSACIESNFNGLIDKAFQLLIVWSGIAAVNCVRLFAQGEPQGWQGICEEDETGDKLLNDSGCGIEGKFSTSEPFTTYYASATFTRVNPDTGFPVTKTATQSSMISQLDANRKAQAVAEWYVLNAIGELL